MRDTKLMKVIEKLSTTELKQLKKFVDSPFFNTNKNVCALLDFIKRYERDFSHEKFTQKDAAYYVFPDLEPDTLAITRLQSKLFRLVEKFIYYNFKDSEAPNMELALMRFYREKNLIPHFNNAYKRAKNIQRDYPYKDAAYYYNQFEIENLHTDFQVTNIPGSQPDYQELIRTMDTSYFIQKLVSFCQILNYQRIAVVDFDMTLMDELLNFLPESSYCDIPVTKLWYTALFLLKFPNQTEHYHQLENLLHQHGNLVNKAERRALYTYLENTARQVFENGAYFKVLFDLYKKQLENGVMYIDGYLLPAIFKNIVTVALRLGYVDWTETFLENNKDKIVPEYEGKEDVYSYSVAQLRFERGEYDEVQTILSQMIFHDIYTKMDVRRMYMKVYYELEYVKLFEDTVNNFRGFLTENSEIISPVHVQANRDFINICYSIYRSIKKEYERIEKIEQRVSKVPVLPERKWLLEKLEALK